MPQTVTVATPTGPTKRARDMWITETCILAQSVYDWSPGDVIVRTLDRVLNLTRNTYDDRLNAVIVRDLAEGEEVVIAGRYEDGQGER